MGLWTPKQEPQVIVPGQQPTRVYADDRTGVTEQDAYEVNRDNWNAANITPNAINPFEAQYNPRGTMAEILRRQWGEFEGTTVPIIKQLEGMTTYGGNTGVVDALKTEARQNAKASFGNVVTDANRQAASLGMSLSPTTKGALERSAKLGMAAAEVDGVNRATQYQQDLNRQIVAGQNLSSLNRN